MFFNKRRIYLDYASATPARLEAQKAYDEGSKLVGNPGTIHAEGVAAANSLRESREMIAAELGCKGREIIFTGGLTEANNLAILGFARRLDHQGPALMDTHWITTAIEHPSVLECFAEIERRGGTVTHLDVASNGRIAPEKLSYALRHNTVFVSIGWANSEIGIVQKLRALAAVIHEHEKKSDATVVFHTDAGQAPIYLAPNVHTLDVDLFSLGSGKLYGPRGIGALYVGKRADIAPIIMGGAQEQGLRAGTEAPALAAGFAAALVATSLERRTEADNVQKLRDQLAARIEKAIPYAVTNTDLKHSLPHMLNISIPDINSEYLVLALDRAGVALSTKAACSEGGVNASHVVAALIADREKTNWRSQNTLRFSLGRETTLRDIEFVARELVRILKEMPR